MVRDEVFGVKVFRDLLDLGAACVAKLVEHQPEVVFDDPKQLADIAENLQQALDRRPDLFEPASLAAAMQKMVEMTPLPILFMRTVIQAETVAPGLREFTLGILRALCRRRVWTMDPKLWEGFMRCAKRATPRSFPVLCELPAAKLAEVVAKFPAMREPMRAYANAPAVAAGVPRAIKDVLNQS